MDVATTFDDELPARPCSLWRLRERFRGWLEPAVEDAFVRHDLVLTMSELAAAALRTHDESVPAGLHARAWIDDEQIVLEVADGPGDRVDESADADPGGGLAVVASLVDVLSVRALGGATHIRASMDLRTPPRADGFPGIVQG